MNRLRGGSGTFYKEVSDCVHQCHCKNCGTHGMSAPGSEVLSLKACCFLKVLVYVIILKKKKKKDFSSWFPAFYIWSHPSYCYHLHCASLISITARTLGRDEQISLEKTHCQEPVLLLLYCPLLILQMWTHQGRDLELTQNAAFLSPSPHSRAWHLIIAWVVLSD